MNLALGALFYTIPPLLLPLISLIFSIILCFSWHHQHLSMGILFLYWFILISLVIYAKGSRFFTLSILCLVAALMGWLSMAHTMHTYEQFPFEQCIQPVCLQGRIINKSFAAKSRMKHNATIAIHTIDGQQPSNEYKIQTYTLQELNAEIGDIIELRDFKIKKPNNLDFHRYLMKEGISATAFNEKIDYHIVHHPTYSFQRWIFNLRKKILLSFKQTLSHRAFTFFSSLFLGEKETNRIAIEHIQKQCKQWGILHYLARSGLHLAIVLSIYEFLFRLFPLSFIYKHLMLLFLSFTYFLLSWPSIAFIRAFLTFFLYKLFALFYIPAHFLHILLITCITILLFNPMQLFFLDFQLSFCLTFALGWLNQYKIVQKSSN